MKDAPSARGRDAPRCGARLRNGDGGTCKQPAGWGTPSSTGPCKLHGGSTRSHLVRAQREEARRTLAELGQAPPVDDPVDALRRLAGSLQESADYLSGQIGHALVDDGKLSPLYAVWHDLVVELRHALAALARVGAPDTVVNVHQGGVPVAEVLERIVIALRPYPAAAAAVSTLALEMAEEMSPQ